MRRVPLPHEEGHVLSVPRPERQGPFRPVVTEHGKIVVLGDGPVWCDPATALTEEPDVIIRQRDVHDTDWSVCGTHVTPKSFRRARADDVARLDIAEAIWVIFAESVPRRRGEMGPCNHSAYWVGVGDCEACDGGLIVVCTTDRPDTLLYVCHGCRRYWRDRADLSRQSESEDVVTGPLNFASADDVAVERLLGESSRDSWYGKELWSIRPRSLLEPRTCQ